MKRIALPVRATLSEFPKQLVTCHQGIIDEKAVAAVDASRTDLFDPFATALLALAFSRRRLQAYPAVLFEPPANSSARTFLDEVALQRFLGGAGSAKESGPQRGTLEMRQLHALNPVYVEDVADPLADRLPGTTQETSYLIQLCLNELLQNVFEHSGSKVGCLVLARWYLASRNVRIVVVRRSA